MDKWLTWLIPLIAIAVWILSQLAGNQQPPKRSTPRPFPPRDPEQDPRSRAPGELEEFLENMKRRKEAEEQTAAERERAAADRAVAEPVLIAEEIVPPRASPPPLPRPVEQRRKSMPVGNKKPPRRPEPVIVIEPPPPVVRTVPMPMSAPAPAVTLATLPAVPAAPAAPQAIHRPEALPARTSLPPVARMVRDLLASRQALAAAILVREVLDPPLCKRRGR